MKKGETMLLLWKAHTGTASSNPGRMHDWWGMSGAPAITPHSLLFIWSFRAGTIFIRLNITSLYVRFWRTKTVPALKGLVRQSLNLPLWSKQRYVFIVILIQYKPRMRIAVANIRLIVDENDLKCGANEKHDIVRGTPFIIKPVAWLLYF